MAGKALLILALGLGSARSQNSSSEPPTTQALPTEVCYTGLGCFNNFYPFNTTGGRLPNPPELIGTKILLFTRQTQSGPGEELSYSDAALIKQSAFNKNLPIKVIIHGFSQNETTPWMHTMKNALLDLAQANVIIVGWGKGASLSDYIQAATNTRIVGRQIAQLLALLVKEGSDYKKMHLIGHSLGAHTCGHVGRESGGKVRRISGLDPAEPTFEYKDVAVRLDKSDATFVDVIHSNGAPIVQGGAGLKQESGHVDFYPNGGEYQPGCPGLLTGGISALLKGNTDELASVASCNHNRAIYFYIESIATDGCSFTAFPCPGGSTAFSSGACLNCGKGCSEMGYHADEYPARGSFYLATDGEPDYCKGPSTAVTLEVASSSVTGNIRLWVTTANGRLYVDYTSNNDKLTGNTTKVLSFPADLNGVRGLSITYKKYGGIFLGINAGPQSWSLTRVIMQSTSGRIMYCAPSEVTDGTELALIRCRSSG